MPGLNGSTRRLLKGKYVPLKIETRIGELLSAIIKRGCIRRLAFVAFASLEILAVLNCSAAPAPVSNTSDSGPGSLRDAIGNANDGDTITFAPGVGGTITLTSGALGINNSITIQGPGAANLTVDGNASDRVFEISNLAIVTISGLKISNGFSTYGGGIHNGYRCTLILSNCWVANNTAQGFAAAGGGIVSIGPLVLVGCTVSGNKAISNAAGVVLGGGIAGTDPISVSLTNCTVTGNVAQNSGGSAQGGGIFVEYGSLNHCTVSGNSAISQVYGNEPGGIYSSVSCVLGDTIVAENNGGPSDLSGESGGFTSLGFNLIGSDVPSVGWLPSDLTSTDPMLGPLKYNGGPTPTMMPAPNSDAVDWGSSGGLSTDQRGLPRPSLFVLFGPYLPPGGDGSDIGAVELQPAILKILRGFTPLLNQLLISWQSDPGMSARLMQSSDAALPAGNWGTSSLPVMTLNGTNGVPINGVLINEPKGNMFFRLKLQ